MGQSADVRRQNRRYKERRLKHSEKGYPKKDGRHFVIHGPSRRRKIKDGLIENNRTAPRPKFIYGITLKDADLMFIQMNAAYDKMLRQNESVKTQQEVRKAFSNQRRTPEQRRDSWLRKMDARVQGGARRVP